MGPLGLGLWSLIEYFCSLASVEGPTVCLEIPLQYTPPPTGDRCALWGEILGGEGAPLIAFLEPYTCGDELVAQEVE